MLTAKHNIKTISLKQFFLHVTAVNPNNLNIKAVLKFPAYHAVCLWLKNNDKRGPVAL